MKNRIVLLLQSYYWD